MRLGTAVAPEKTDANLQFKELMMTSTRVLSAAVIAAFAFAAGTANAQNQRQEESQNRQQNQNRSQSQSQNKSQQAQSTNQIQQQAGAPTIVLVPVAIAMQSDFSDGCWARLYTGDHFEGDRLQLVGPTDMANMRTAFGRDWSGEFESLEVGPKATLTVYDNENYTQRVATFNAGQRVAELDDRMGWFQQIRSVRIACSGAAQTAQGDGAAPNDSASAGSSQKK